MKLVVISGRSGSGKSLALKTMEDMGFYCIDNLPADLLPEVLSKISHTYEQVAVGIDARSFGTNFSNFPKIRQTLETNGWDIDVLFFDANEVTLLKRFSETRRRHPLTRDELSLQQALEQERTLLEHVAMSADLIIDTSFLTPNQMKEQLKSRLSQDNPKGLGLLFQSFGFKHGIPTDANFVFDARCLPNPYWDENLRKYSGLDQPVKDFLEEQPRVMEFFWQIKTLLHTWLPRFEKENRSYMTIAIGCTGGQHRSVYMSELLAKHFSESFNTVQIQHRELKITNKVGTAVK
jgi:UPF0042 nucleotide-binding protein